MEGGFHFCPAAVFTELGTVADVLCPDVPKSPDGVEITYSIKDGPIMEATRAAFHRVAIDEIGRRVLASRNDEAFIFIPEDSVRVLLDLPDDPVSGQDSDHGFEYHAIGSEESFPMCMDEPIVSYTFEHTYQEYIGLMEKGEVMGGSRHRLITDLI